MNSELKNILYKCIYSKKCSNLAADLGPALVDFLFFHQVHSRAFPEKSLLNRLTFSNCSLSSVAEKSISSAISSLEIRNSSLASLSQEAVFSHVAKVGRKAMLVEIRLSAPTH